MRHSTAVLSSYRRDDEMMPPPELEELPQVELFKGCSHT